MNPMPVVTDKVLPALEPYPDPSSPVVSNYETGEATQIENSRCGDLPLRCSCCSPLCIQVGFLYSEAFHYLLEGLECSGVIHV